MNRHEFRQWIIPLIIIIFGAYACSNQPSPPPDDPLTAPTPATATTDLGRVWQAGRQAG